MAIHSWNLFSIFFMQRLCLGKGCEIRGGGH
jgi:hypothetical protein